MSEEYRGLDREPGPSRWLRGRWQYGSVLVLNIDHLICDPDAKHGLLIEWKHDKATDKTWRVTRTIAGRLGWWSSLFVYTTVDGTDTGEITGIVAEFRDPSGRSYPPTPLDEPTFDAWVCRELGAKPRQEAA